ncbi:DUF7510 family protein [Halalkalirubrum salinum]|uniref:DUF7510 family protein n=1 Tax=Halalkalirubrum salinum TaxID=2563889 RepID=UPI0010C051B4|nr:hypothetical protein [Halalkalirubrum salinum]
MADRVEYTTSIENGRTEIRVSGETDVAFVIRSESGERIYLPPEEANTPVPRDRQTPYDGAGTSYDRQNPYQPDESSYQRGDSAYQRGEGTSYQSADSQTSTRGVIRTRRGFRIVHPEPATEITVVRDGDIPTTA